MSTYHRAISLLLATGGKGKGLLKRYEVDIVGVIEPLFRALRRAAALMVHRIVEESRCAKLLDGASRKSGISMTESPETADPDSDEPHRLRHYTSKDIAYLTAKAKERAKRLESMRPELDELGLKVHAALPWLERAMGRYASHSAALDKAGDRRERRRLDHEKEDKTYRSGRPPKIEDKGPIFSKRPEADYFSLAQQCNIYKHGIGKSGELRPLEIGHHREIAEALFRLSGELTEYSPQQWARSKIKGAKPNFEDLWRIVRDIFLALLDGLEWDEEKRLELERKLDRVDRMDQETDMPKPQRKDEPALALAAKSKRPKRPPVDWANFFKGVKERSFLERVETKRKWYKRDRLGRFASRSNQEEKSA